MTPTDTAHSAYKTMDQMVPKTEQIVMLYEGAIRYVQQAKAGIEEGDIQQRYNGLTKACDILTGLQRCLDFDQGGEIAQLLYDYYAGIDMCLMTVHQNNDASMCDRCLGYLRQMRDAWKDVDVSTRAGSEAMSQEAEQTLRKAMQPEETVSVAAEDAARDEAPEAVSASYDSAEAEPAKAQVQSISVQA